MEHLRLYTIGEKIIVLTQIFREILEWSVLEIIDNSHTHIELQAYNGSLVILIIITKKIFIQIWSELNGDKLVIKCR